MVFARCARRPVMSGLLALIVILLVCQVAYVTQLTHGNNVETPAVTLINLPSAEPRGDALRDARSVRAPPPPPVYPWARRAHSDEDIAPNGIVPTGTHSEEEACASMFSLSPDVGWVSYSSHLPHGPEKGSDVSSVDCYWNHALKSTACHYANLAIDAAKVNVSDGGEDPLLVRWRPEELEFPRFEMGAFAVAGVDLIDPVKPEITMRSLPYPQNALRSLGGTGSLADRQVCTRWEKRTAVFVTRFEYCNLYHQATDWFNTFQTLKLFNIKDPDVVIVFMDGHAQCQLDEAWGKIFGGKVVRLSELIADGGMVCIENAIFVPLGYRSALSHATGEETPCKDVESVRQFADHVLEAYPQSKPEANTKQSPRITVVARRDGVDHPRREPPMKRQFYNETAVRAALWHMPFVELVDFAAISFSEQLRIIRSTDILVGAHGAGLTHALFMGQGSGLLEFHFFGSYPNHHFDNLARVVGRAVYTAWAFDQVGPLLDPHPHAVLRGETDPVPTIVVAEEMFRVHIDILRNMLLPYHSEWHKLCIIIPFRDSQSNLTQGLGREGNLNEMRPYMSDWLLRHGVEFKIIVAEQTQGGYFNKGAMFNSGFMMARSECDYVVAHDVDQLPVDERNDYHFNDKVIHLCAQTTQDGFVSYHEMFGGALMLTARHFMGINGYSNAYWGWGREDDDICRRVKAFYPSEWARLDGIGVYKALHHTRVKDLDVTPQFYKNDDYLRTITMTTDEVSREVINKDGFRSLNVTLMNVRALDPTFERYVFRVDSRFNLVDVPHTEDSAASVEDDHEDESTGAKDDGALGLKLEVKESPSLHGHDGRRSVIPAGLTPAVGALPSIVRVREYVADGMEFAQLRLDVLDAKAKANPGFKHPHPPNTAERAAHLEEVRMHYIHRALRAMDDLPAPGQQMVGGVLAKN